MAVAELVPQRVDCIKEHVDLGFRVVVSEPDPDKPSGLFEAQIVGDVQRIEVPVPHENAPVTQDSATWRGVTSLSRIPTVGTRQ